MPNAILTCSEHFTDLALNELRRQHNPLTLINKLSPQHLYIQHNTTFGNLTRPWQRKCSIYLHHLFPVHQTIDLHRDTRDFDSLRHHAQALSQGKPFAVQVQMTYDYAYAPRMIVQHLNPAQHISQYDAPAGRVLSILIDRGTAYMGISWANQNISPFGGGRQYFEEPVSNRAGLKLLEALETFKIHLRPNDRALDLGAAPGAWTEILRRRGMRVTAVAPTEMYDWLRTDKQVQSLQMTAEEYLAECATTYDLLLNDMRLDARDSARLMVEYAQHLRSEGLAIMTLKLRLEQPRRLMDHLLSPFAESLQNHPSASISA